MKKMIIIGAIAAAVVMAGVGWYVFAGSRPSITLRTAKVERGDLQATISATGTIEPRGGPTDVTAQVNGPIIGFGYDPNSYDPESVPSGFPYATEAKGQRRLVDFGTVVKGGPYKLTETALQQLEEVRVPKGATDQLRKVLDKEFDNKEKFIEQLYALTQPPDASKDFTVTDLSRFQQLILNFANNATVLAQVDPATYQSAVDGKRAFLKSADASVRSAAKSVDADKQNVESTRQRELQIKAQADQYEAEWGRAVAAFPKGGISASDRDVAYSNYRQGQANVLSAAAAIKQAEAVVESDQAKLNTQEANLEAAIADLQNAVINLGYCRIRAPHDGTIIDRRVNIGQTIVSNQSATSLFLLAKDLGDLEVWTSVNEADMANVRVGQEATFTVDAYPGQTFNGQVAQCRPNATMQQNVVTYNVVISVKNPKDKDHPNGRLLPYMTANVKFIMQKEENVLLVPNSALRYKPSPELIVPDARTKFANKKIGPKGPNDQTAGSGSKDKDELPTLWVKDGKYVRPVMIHIGMSDGVSTEITGNDVEEGAVVVTGESRGGDGGDAKSPFTPQLFKR